MRFRTELSRLRSCLLASSDSSMSQLLFAVAKLLHHLFERNGSLLAASDSIQHGFGGIYIFQVLKVAQDRFARVISLGTARMTSQLFQALFDGSGKTDCQHAIPRYTSIADPAGYKPCRMSLTSSFILPPICRNLFFSTWSHSYV